MKPVRVLLAGWTLAGFGAALGSIIGTAFGRTGLFIGAVLGGILATAAAVQLLVKLGWLPLASSWGALAGGLLGFAIAVPIAVANLHTPIVPMASCALVGVGLLLGAGAVAGFRAS